MTQTCAELASVYDGWLKRQLPLPKIMHPRSHFGLSLSITSLPPETTIVGLCLPGGVGGTEVAPVCRQRVVHKRIARDVTPQPLSTMGTEGVTMIGATGLLKHSKSIEKMCGILWSGQGLCSYVACPCSWRFVVGIRFIDPRT